MLLRMTDFVGVASKCVGPVFGWDRRWPMTARGTDLGERTRLQRWEAGAFSIHDRAIHRPCCSCGAKSHFRWKHGIKLGFGVYRRYFGGVPSTFGILRGLRSQCHCEFSHGLGSTQSGMTLASQPISARAGPAVPCGVGAPSRASQGTADPRRVWEEGRVSLVGASGTKESPLDQAGDCFPGMQGLRASLAMTLPRKPRTPCGRGSPSVLHRAR